MADSLDYMMQEIEGELAGQVLRIAHKVSDERMDHAGNPPARSSSGNSKNKGGLVCKQDKDCDYTVFDTIQYTSFQKAAVYKCYCILCTILIIVNSFFNLFFY